MSAVLHAVAASEIYFTSLFIYTLSQIVGNGVT